MAEQQKSATSEKPVPSERDERFSIEGDPEDALRGLMKVRPGTPQGGTDFALAVADEVPSLRAVLEEHLRDNSELLPHVFFGRVAACARDLARRTDQQAIGELDHLLGHLERGLAADEPYVTDLIRDSFIENAQPPSEYKELRARLMQRPLLRRAYVECVGSGEW